MTFLKKALAAAALAVAVSASTCAASVYLPGGPQNDVMKSTVTGGGWTQVYSGNFRSGAAYTTVFNNLKDWVLIATAQVGSGTFDLLAAIRTSDFNALPTGLNLTQTHNGADWYRNGYSLGFAPQGAPIFQTSADICDAWNRAECGAIDPVRGDQRMSWHTSGGYNNAPTYVGPGWRSGTNAGTVYDGTWERFVFTASEADLHVSPVPVPASVAFLALGLAGMAGAARLQRRRRA